jgi:tetratricopeptide (TPR) repeat protein/membrane protein YdbS with pleckstrin-like domain
MPMVAFCGQGRNHVAQGTWRANRLALIAGALALLAGTPAILAAAQVKNPWVLAGTTAAAAVVVVFSAVWQERYRRQIQRRDEQELHIRDGCLVLADGRLPAVHDITDPVMLGVHQTAALAGAAASSGAARTGAPAYVPRDVDDELRERLAVGGFVLLVGDSTAGKSRAAFEAVSGTLGGHVLICPSGREAIAVAVDRAAQERQCVLWLDDLERYLGAGGLTAAQLGRLLSGEGHHRVIVASIRAAEQARITADAAGDDTGRQALRDIRRVLDQAHPIRVARMFTSGELDRARAREWDPRIAEAIGYAGSYGIAEYLAAGPELLRDWEDAFASSEGPHVRGAALVAAAIDIRRAGYVSPIPRALLAPAHEHYLTDPEHAHAPREPADDAWAWATRQRRATTALLRPTETDRVEVFDYLVDNVQRRAGALGPVAEPVVRDAISFASPADADSLADTALAQGRYSLAEHAWRLAYQTRANDPSFGPGHPDTLTSRNNLANALYWLGRLEEAEREHRGVLEARIRLLGPDDPDTLASRNNLAEVLRRRGRFEESEREHRAVLEARIRLLGPDHRDTLASRNNLANVLHGQGRFEESEREHRAVLEALSRLLGPDDPDTLASRNNLASVLDKLGRFEESEREHRAVLEARTRLLGPDHPDTWASRNNLGNAVCGLGRFEEAEREHRAVLEARTRLLGPDHPDTWASRNNLAEVLRRRGRFEESEREHRAVLEARTRLLGPDHPDTLMSRDNLANVHGRHQRYGASGESAPAPG